MITKEVAGESKEPKAGLKQLAIVFGDLTGTTPLLMTAGDLALQNAVREFFDRVAQHTTAHQGGIVKFIGDGFMVVFNDATTALAFAIALQRSLAEEPLLGAGQRLGVRMSLHVGPVSLVQTSYGEDVVGPDVNLAARLESQAQPGEIVVSEAARLVLPEDQQRMLGPSEQSSVKGNPVAFYRLTVA